MRSSPGHILSRGLSRSAVIAFLALALVLGGATREGGLGHGALQLLSVFILVWCAWDTRLQRMSAGARQGVMLAGAIAGLGLVQLLPLPPALWQNLPARDGVAQGFELVGAQTPWLGLSLAPEGTLSALLHLLPAIAVFVLVSKLTWHTLTAWLAWGVASLVAGTVALGIFQLLEGRDSAAYFYDFTNRGSPVGFFANVNHQATLTLMAIPFVAALAGELVEDWRGRDDEIGQAILIATLGTVAVTGVMIAGSGAGYLLLAPVLVMSVSVFRGRAVSRGLSWRIPVAALAVIALSAANLAASPILADFGVPQVTNEELARRGIWNQTVAILADHWVFGTGLGSFEPVYASYETPQALRATFINHAHNDYLEWLMETGLAGGLILFAGLAWWTRSIVASWQARSRQSERRLKRAAAIATLAIAAHSLVDYPVRTPAITVFGALCLGVLVKQRGLGRVQGRTRDDDTPAPETRSVEL